MKTIIQIHKEGKYFIAVDLITNVADQGLTEDEAIANLKKGLEEHYQMLMELAPKNLVPEYKCREICPDFQFYQLSDEFLSKLN